ncbi:hypothetical protein [Weizmannia acidilactici]|uniref:hypothetical protein n=1 Tax=Weizmannia acidilactici TaxID=2607726 RepID=UPI00124CA38E|nr:hypothetical protein [Weizmannia acidilactici]GER73433.1 hypothetical protein BpPP18_15000 [Weizmannia acidilactici]
MAEVKVRKGNRVLNVPDTRLDRFLQQGYDQIDEAGNIIKRATGGRMVSLAEYNKLLDRIAELEANQKGSKSKKSE